MANAPWDIVFFESSSDDSPEVPTVAFLGSCPPKVAARIVVVLEAVAASPPPQFGGGGYWQAMHGKMNRFFEVRVGHGNFNYRLLCLRMNPLFDEANTEPGPAIVCLTGFRKPVRSAANDGDYRAARDARDEFARTHRIAR